MDRCIILSSSQPSLETTLPPEVLLAYQTEMLQAQTTERLPAEVRPSADNRQQPTKAFDPFNFEDDDGGADEDGAKEDKESASDKGILLECIKEMRQFHVQKAQGIFERLRQEKKLLGEYWEVDREKKMKALNRMRFKNETTDEEEIFRFIYNN